MSKRRECYNKADIRIQLDDQKIDETLNKIYLKIKIHVKK